MFRLVLLAVLLLVPHFPVAGERVSATNFYVLNQEEFIAGGDVFWMQDNVGTFTVSEGPIEDGFVRCGGSGFGENKWRIIDATGKYAGMRGRGTTKTRVKSKFLKLRHRESDWNGEISLPKAE